MAPVALVRPAPAAAARSSAVGNAMSKIGAPYRWGATGPNAFDCSGLVSWAFKKVGVSLPRTSSAMSKVGKPVSKADLQPGDLVFFYTPVSHVGIYVGGGKIVHATNRKHPVKVSGHGRDAVQLRPAALSPDASRPTRTPRPLCGVRVGHRRLRCR